MASYKSGSGTENIYVPRLWYFKELDFLRDQESQVQGTCTIADLHESENEDTVSLNNIIFVLYYD